MPAARYAADRQQRRLLSQQLGVRDYVRVVVSCPPISFASGPPPRAVVDRLLSVRLPPRLVGRNAFFSSALRTGEEAYVLLGVEAKFYAQISGGRVELRRVHKLPAQASQAAPCSVTSPSRFFDIF